MARVVVDAKDLAALLSTLTYTYVRPDLTAAVIRLTAALDAATVADGA